MSLSNWRQVLYYIGLVSGGLLFAYQIWVGYQAFSPNSIHSAPLWILLVAVVLISIVMSLQVGIWAYLMTILGVSTTWRQVVRGYILSALLRYIPGAIWSYLSRGQWLFQAYGVPHNLSNSASFLELLALVVAAGVILGGYWGTLVSGQMGLALFLLALSSPFVAWIVLRSITNWSFLQWFGNKTGLLAVGSFRISLRHWLAVILLDIGLWLGLGGALFLIIQGWGLSSTIGILDAVSIFTAAWLLGFAVIFVPAGLGIREVALSGLLMSGMGISPGTASAIAVTMRFALLSAELLYLVGVSLFK